jgi:hypothetical protein
MTLTMKERRAVTNTGFASSRDVSRPKKGLELRNPALHQAQNIQGRDT